MDTLLSEELTALQLKKLYQKALRLLTRRDWGRQELFQRLADYLSTDWPADLPTDFAAIINQTLDRLTAEGYLSELRFLTSYVNMRRQKGFGPLRIMYELKQRHVDETLIAEAVEPRNAQWDELARRLADKKRAQAKTPIQQMRFLLARGFSSAQARKVIQNHSR